MLTVAVKVENGANNGKDDDDCQWNSNRKSNSRSRR